MYSDNTFFRHASSHNTLSVLFVTLFLLVAGAVFATELEEVDPDPGTTQLLYMSASEFVQLDPASLAPGRYLLRVVQEDGSETVLELVVP